MRMETIQIKIYYQIVIHGEDVDLYINHPMVNMSTRRHHNHLNNVLNDESDIYMLWYGFSLEQIKWFRESLKLEIRVPFDDQKEMRSFHHLWSSDVHKRVDGFFI